MDRFNWICIVLVIRKVKLLRQQKKDSPSVLTVLLTHARLFAGSQTTWIRLNGIQR